MSANFVGNTLTQSKAIKTYTPYDVTSSRPRKTKIAFFVNFGGVKNILRTGTELKFENYESVQHRLQFSGIKKGLKFHFIGTLITCFTLATVFQVQAKSGMAKSRSYIANRTPKLLCIDNSNHSEDLCLKIT